MRNFQAEFQLSAQCRDGPLKNDRHCTDPCCCIAYIFLLSIIFFLALSARTTTKQIDFTNVYVASVVAISDSIGNIFLSLLFAMALCTILLLISFIIPSLTTYILVPIFPILMAVIGAACLYRHFHSSLPFVNNPLQDNNYSLFALIAGIILCTGSLLSIVVLCLKKKRIIHMTTMLNLARSCFWQNGYMMLICFSLSLLSIATLYGNIRLLAISLLDTQTYIPAPAFTLLILFQLLWTHGCLQALSDFIFQSIAIHWYFNQKHLGKGYSKIANNLCPTLSLTLIHCGTIVYGHILAFLPQTLGTLIDRTQQLSPCCHTALCCKFCLCTRLSKYCYNKTILQSRSFCSANYEINDIRTKAKVELPELYMLGNFYVTLCKLFIVPCVVVLSYFLLIQMEKTVDLHQIVPPLAVILLGTIEISNHFMDCTGLISDSLLFMYVVDLEIEKNYFKQIQPYSCPMDVQTNIAKVRNQIDD